MLQEQEEEEEEEEGKHVESITCGFSVGKNVNCSNLVSKYEVVKVSESLDAIVVGELHSENLRLLGSQPVNVV